MGEPAQNLPTVFISHGLVGETMRSETALYKGLNKYYNDQKLQERVKTAIIVSAHWEDSELTVNLNPSPRIVHDHPSEWLFPFDFPLETDIELANQIHKRLVERGLKINVTNKRDSDHGSWGGLFSLYDIKTQQNVYNKEKKQHVPKVVLVSLHRNMNSQLHFDLGQILGEFRNSTTLLICSGASTHNFNNNRKPGFTELSIKWEQWLESVVTNENAEERNKLVDFKKNKMYDYMHHSDEHFMPLVVAVGSSQKPGKLFCLEQQFTSMCSCYTFN